MTKALVAFIAMMILGCTTESSDNQVERNCLPFFTFDKVEHYHIDITEDSTNYLKAEGHGLTPRETRLADLLLSDSTMTLSDSLKLSTIGELGYTSREVDKSKFEKLNDVLCQGVVPDEKSVYACLPKFRDLLVFKENNRTVGFVKVCFECNQAVFAGTTRNTFGFGASGEYEKLADVLDQDKITQTK